LFSLSPTIAQVIFPFLVRASLSVLDTRHGKTALFYVLLGFGLTWFPSPFPSSFVLGFVYSRGIFWAREYFRGLDGVWSKWNCGQMRFSFCFFNLARLRMNW
jgi:hypothetical protein